LSHYAPHIAEELWRALGNSATLAYEPTIAFEEILDGGVTANPLELWKRVVRSDFELSSEPGGRHGHFEFFAFGQDENHKLGAYRLILDDNGHRRILARCAMHFPLALWIDDQLLSMDRSGVWEHRRQDWGFQFDRRGRDSPMQLAEPGEGTENVVRFHLGGSLSRLVPLIPSASWDAATRTLIAEGRIAEAHQRAEAEDPQSMLRFADSFLNHDYRYPVRLQPIHVEDLDVIAEEVAPLMKLLGYGRLN
jgi:hypothetical protein